MQRKHSYVVGPQGTKEAVVVPLGEYEQLLEDYRDLKTIAERKENLKIPAALFVQRLRKRGRV